VVLPECPACGQGNVQIFSETIDWANGDDAQFWRLVPVTMEESQQLIAAGGANCISVLSEMAKDRCHLAIDYPTGGVKTTYCSQAFVIHPHD
jgi:hypothetical protein